jgi:hypothetical protein
LTTSPPDPPSETPPEPKPYDPKEGVEDWGEYDERALDQYRAHGFYLSRRRLGATKAQASQMTCEVFGHDAPRGLCLRCGLGVDLTQDSKTRKRLAERQDFLASRHG